MNKGTLGKVSVALSATHESKMSVLWEIISQVKSCVIHHFMSATMLHTMVAFAFPISNSLVVETVEMNHSNSRL